MSDVFGIRSPSDDVEAGGRICTLCTRLRPCGEISPWWFESTRAHGPKLELGLHVAEDGVIYNHMVVAQIADDDADCIFRALGAATRRDILVRTIRQEQSVSALARHYDMSLTAVQKHVAVLERAALVTKERRGREQIVRGHRSTLLKAAALLDAYEELWIERATQIADILADEKGSTT